MEYRKFIGKWVSKLAGDFQTKYRDKQFEKKNTPKIMQKLNHSMELCRLVFYLAISKLKCKINTHL